MPSDKLRTLQNARLRTTVDYVFGRVPFYRRRLGEAGIEPSSFRGIEDVAKLPFTTKQDLRDHYPTGMFAVPASEIVRIHASSGTTGKPSIVGYTRHDVDVFSEVVARCLAACGAKPGMTFHNAYGYGLFTGGLGLHYGGERLGLAVVPVSGGMTDRQVMLIEDLKPEVIACTPSYAQTLAEEFRRRKIEPEQISLRYGILGAEPWTEAVRKDVEAGLGITATNIYGLSEIIGPGVSNEDYQEQDGSYVWEDHFYPEIVHPETKEVLPEGEAGVLVITTLTKQALPLLRYWTGDITHLTREAGTTGRTHARMGMIRGRSDDMLIIRGVNVYPTQIEDLLTNIFEVAPHYQLVVRRERTMDTLELRLEISEDVFRRLPHEHLSEGVVEADEMLRQLRTRIQARVRNTVGITVTVTLLAPGQAPRSEGGKLRRILDERKA